jgi:hypothetical protein
MIDAIGKLFILMSSELKNFLEILRTIILHCFKVMLYNDLLVLDVLIYTV